MPDVSGATDARRPCLCPATKETLVLDAFRLGGWGMYPTTLMGFVLLLASVQYARHPERRRLPLVLSLGVLTFLAGTLGFVTGVIKTLLHAVDEPDLGNVIASGVGESLNNIGLALSLLIVATIAVSVGAFRASRGPGAPAIGRVGAEQPHGS